MFTGLLDTRKSCHSNPQCMLACYSNSAIGLYSDLGLYFCLNRELLSDTVTESILKSIITDTVANACYLFILALNEYNLFNL